MLALVPGVFIFTARVPRKKQNYLFSLQMAFRNEILVFITYAFFGATYLQCLWRLWGMRVLLREMWTPKCWISILYRRYGYIVAVAKDEPRKNGSKVRNKLTHTHTHALSNIYTTCFCMGAKHWCPATQQHLMHMHESVSTESRIG